MSALIRKDARMPVWHSLIHSRYLLKHRSSFITLHRRAHLAEKPKTARDKYNQSASRMDTQLERKRNEKRNRTYLEPAVAGNMHSIVRPSRIVRQDPESKGADSSHPRSLRRVDSSSVPGTTLDIPFSGGIVVSIVAANGAVRMPLVGCCNALSLGGKGKDPLGMLERGNRATMEGTIYNIGPTRS